MKKLAATLLLSAFAAAPALADNTGTYYVAADVGSATYSNLPGWSNPNVIRICGRLLFQPGICGRNGLFDVWRFEYKDPVYGPAVISATSFQLAGLWPSCR